MVMNYGLFDTKLHMFHHYKRIRSATSVVNSSPPKNYLLRDRSPSTSLCSRYSTPSLLRKNDIPPSRQLEAQKKWPSKKNSSPKSGSTSRSARVPPRPFTRRNIKTIPHNYLTTVKKNSREIEYVHEDNKQFPCTGNEDIVIMNNNTDPNEMLNSKISIPAASGAPFVSQNAIAENTDYEYLRFSLRITEDIIRNNLYNPKDMERVFSSHIEANRDRLEMKKMLEQIKQLQDEINIKKMLEDCKNAEYPNVNLLNHIIHRNEISSEQMQQMTENELQYVITGILNPEQLDMCSLCMRENAGCFKKETERRQRNISTINEFMANKYQSSKAKIASEIYNDYNNESDPTSSATDEYDDYRKSEKSTDQSKKSLLEMEPSQTKKFGSFSSASDRSSRIEEEIEYQELSRLEEDHFKTKSNIESFRESLEEDVRTNKEIYDKKELQIPTSHKLEMPTFPQSISNASRAKELVKTQSDREEKHTFPQSNSTASRAKGLSKKESGRKEMQTSSQYNVSPSRDYELVEEERHEIEMPMFPQSNISVSMAKELVKKESSRKEMPTFPQSISSASRAKELVKTQSDREEKHTFPQSNSTASRAKGLSKKESDRKEMQTSSQYNVSPSRDYELVEEERHEIEMPMFPQSNISVSMAKELVKKESSRKEMPTFPQSISSASRAKELVKTQSDREEKHTFPQSNSTASRAKRVAKKESNKKEKHQFPQSHSGVSWAKGLGREESDLEEVQTHTQSTSSSSRSDPSKKEGNKKEVDPVLSFAMKNLVNISSETADPVLKMHSDTQTILESYIIEKPSTMRENSRGSVDKNIQTTVRPEMPAQYSLKPQHSNISNTVDAFVENINTAVAKKISDLYKPVPPRAKTIKNNVDAPYKTGKKSSVLSHLNVEELPPPIIIPPRPDKNEAKDTTQILKHLKKYETNSESPVRRTSISSYELSIFTDQCETYIPKFHRTKFFPDISTQTNLQWTPPAESSLSDGEVKNSTSESDDTKTDVT